MECMKPLYTIKNVPVTAEDGLAVVKIIEAAYASNAARKVIDL
jgi:predicted dehydrogenase